MEKHVLVVDKEKFMRSHFEAALKDSKIKVMAIESLVDHYYLIDDLKPCALFFDIHSTMGEYHKILGYQGQTKLIAMGFPEDFDLLKGIDEKLTMKIEKPISAQKFKAFIEEILC